MTLVTVCSQREWHLCLKQNTNEMKPNVGGWDRWLRALLAMVWVVLVMNGVLRGTAAYITGIFALIFLVTAVARVCPTYSLFGWSTITRSKK